MKMVSNDELSNLLVNLATYLDCIVLENSSPAWPAILTQFDVFFRRLLIMMSSNSFEMDSVLKMMIGVLKIPGLAAAKVRCLHMLYWVLISCTVLYDVTCILHRVSKKLCQLIFCSVLVKYESLSTKIGRHVLEEITNKTVQKVPTSPIMCASTTLGNLKWQIELSM